MLSNNQVAKDSPFLEDSMFERETNLNIDYLNSLNKSTQTFLELSDPKIGVNEKLRNFSKNKSTKYSSSIPESSHENEYSCSEESFSISSDETSSKANNHKSENNFDKGFAIVKQKSLRFLCNCKRSSRDFSKKGYHKLKKVASNRERNLKFLNQLLQKLNCVNVNDN